MLISLLVDRKKGTSPSPSCSARPIEPTPGKIPSQLEIKIKMKRVAIKGKNFLVFSLSPVTVVIKVSMPPIKASVKFWILPGTGFRRLFIKSPKPMSNTMVIQDINMVLEIGHPPTSNNFSGKKEMLTPLETRGKKYF